jgi:aconitate hydratase
VIVAGRAFGVGSSRDWSAKGPAALGVFATIAESYERIYRSNLVAAGVLPLQFADGYNRKVLRISGTETFDFDRLAQGLEPRARLTALMIRSTGEKVRVPLIACVDTAEEVEHIRHGGLLLNLLRQHLHATTHP